MSAATVAVSLPEQIAEVRREIGLREHLYPRWVVAGKLSQAKADRGLATMRAVLATLEQVDAERRPRLDF